jgi:mannose-6-phosphate isomerase-like protein (cupin superfamily)
MREPSVTPTDLNSPCRVNDALVTVETIEHDVDWYRHDNEDKFFYVVDGRFAVDLEDRSIELGPRQGFMIPKGRLHRTRAPEQSVVLIVGTSD